MTEQTWVMAVEKTGDRKLGAASVTYVSQGSCDPICPFFPKPVLGLPADEVTGSCYANQGKTAIWTRRLNAAPIGNPEVMAEQEADKVRTLSGVYPLRLHVVGDCRTDAAAQTVAAAAREHTAKAGQPAWSYTHAWRSVDAESWDGVSILASCETGDDITAAKARGYATALVYDNGTKTPERKAFSVNGQRVIPCPQQVQPGKVTCVGSKDTKGCGLCLNAQRLIQLDVTIGFHAHGSEVKTRQALTNAGAAIGSVTR